MQNNIRIQNLSCPNCGGDIEVANQRFTCGYCGKKGVIQWNMPDSAAPSSKKKMPDNISPSYVIPDARKIETVRAQMRSQIAILENRTRRIALQNLLIAFILLVIMVAVCISIFWIASK